MGWQQTVFVYPTFVATVVAIFFALYAIHVRRTRGPDPLITYFLGAATSAAIWTFFSALKLSSTNPEVKLLMYQLLHVGAAGAVPFLFLFALAYTDRHDWLTPPFVAGVFVVPAAFVTLLFLNPHDIVITDYRLFDEGLVIMRVDSGPGFTVFSAYNTVLMITTVGIIAEKTRRMGSHYVPQALLLGGAIFVPFTVSLLTTFRVPPFTADTVNFVPASAAVSIIFVGLAIHQYRFLDLQPVAYSTAMEHSPDGLVVLDGTGRIVDANRRGTEFMDALDVAVGDPIGDAFEGWQERSHEELHERSNEGTNEGGEDSRYEIEHDGDLTHVSLRTQPLERGGREVGEVLVMRDVTEQHRHERRLERQRDNLDLLNQMVRHDIRNDLQLILSYADMIESQLDGENEQLEEYLQYVLERGDNAVTITEEARNLAELMLEDDVEPRPTPLGDHLEAQIETCRASRSDAVVRVEGDIPDVTVLANEMLDSVFANLLNNAIFHNDADPPEIVVTVEEPSEHRSRLPKPTSSVVVRIADNGPGIPPDRRKEIFGKSEKGIESEGTGMGLYLVTRLVEQYGGSVWIEDNEPRGAIFTVELEQVSQDADR